jgi:radical SAM superfamily enzyme
MGIESPHDRILKQLNKGFTSDTVKKAFRTLKKYPIYYHGYFIYGNIGETKEEMLCISKFAKEIGVDSITFQKLRIEKFSQLREIAEKAPGYYVTESGELYSDAYSHRALKKIGRHIKFSFYTPLQVAKIFSRSLKVKLFTLKEMMSFLAISPVLLKNIIARDIQKARLGDSLKRIFIRNKA